MSISNRTRRPSGQPSGGQYAEEAKGPSGITLSESACGGTDQFLAGLSSSDRRLAEALLDVDGWHFRDREEAYDDISDFKGYEGPDFANEIEAVGSQLSSLYDHEVGVLNAPWLNLERGGDGELYGYSALARAGNGTNVSVYHDLGSATYDTEATGTDAALSTARALEEDFRHVMAERDRLTPPSMERMRAAVQVDTWRAAEAKVQFVASEDGPIEQATMRTGRYSDDQGGTFSPPDADDRQGYVRFTMSNTGTERFYPWNQVEDMVVGHRIARED